MNIKYRAWGIGLGRTGTTSFCDALRILGYQNVVHNPTFEQLRYLDGASDNGCTIFYKYLDYKFPDSKFILLIRDLKSWLDSTEYIHGYTPPDRSEDLIIMRRMLMYGTPVFDREKFIDVYYSHHEEIRKYFRNRPGDLLEMNITAGDGWEKLCPFLDLPIPTQPFCFRNKRKDGITSGSSVIAKKIVQAKNIIF
ncbi:sulfotransferase family protein [Candidatus Electronema sp. PJ]|uniref:sulfotransferase family protein n=1 Tax=Candidatus Electronema sp. PJ TaxID=3401572 RepID=UPI003AA89737